MLTQHRVKSPFSLAHMFSLEMAFVLPRGVVEGLRTNGGVYVRDLISDPFQVYEYPANSALYFVVVSSSFVMGRVEDLKKVLRHGRSNGDYVTLWCYTAMTANMSFVVTFILAVPVTSRRSYRMIPRISYWNPVCELWERGLGEPDKTSDSFFGGWDLSLARFQVYPGLKFPCVYELYIFAS